jgi:hypothetical protein
MKFKYWLEHYGGKYPEKGDYLVVLKPNTLVAGTVPEDEGPVHLPEGDYIIVIVNHNANQYMIKNTRTDKMYFINIDDVDEAIERKELKVE